MKPLTNEEVMEITKLLLEPYDRIRNPFHKSVGSVHQKNFGNRIHDVIHAIREGLGDGYYISDDGKYIVVKLHDDEKGKRLRELTLRLPAFLNSKMYYIITYNGHPITSDGNLFHKDNPIKTLMKFGNEYEAFSYKEHMLQYVFNRQAFVSDHMDEPKFAFMCNKYFRTDNPFDLEAKLVRTYLIRKKNET